MARRDLQAIHDVLAANHPGPVDPRNDFFRTWLTRGLVEAGALAREARGYGGYRLALLRYTNGFRDGHISVLFALNAERLVWPGFVVDRVEDQVRVAASLPDSAVPEGAVLVSCDGHSVEQLMADRLDPYFWNADIPHVRWNSLPALFIHEPGDPRTRPASCLFRVDGTERTITLNWTREARSIVSSLLSRLRRSPNEIGVRQVGGVWFVTLPSFNFSGAGAAPITGLIDELRRRAPELRNATLVFDVRGNAGGNSAWGRRVIASLWGEPWVERIANSFDWTVDWRVSAANIEHLGENIERSRRDGLAEGVRSWGRARDLMVAARDRGESLARSPAAATPPVGPAPANPMTGRIFVLTDNACASACLDFLDIMRRLPGVRQIGMPTGADAVYIDNAGAQLPSGLAMLSYSLKVYRNRVRGHNQWYEPHVAWPGGAMTSEALVSWIGTLQ